MRASLSLIAAALLVSGCSLFSSDKAAKPTPLETLAASDVKPRVLWNARVDGAGFPLAVALRGEQLVVAGDDGVIQSLNVATGQPVWRADANRKLKAGVGSDGRFAAVVTRDNELAVFDAGKPLWRKTLNTPVVTAPFVAGERVFVLTVDRQVLAFDALDGSKIWDLRRPGDALTLAQAGAIGAYKDTLVVGQGARLAGVDPLRGTVRWEANVANPRGTNEVERLADAIGPLVRDGSVICARAFQSAVGCISAERGAMVWSRQNSGVNGVGGDSQFIYGADANDRLTAFKIANGDTVWTAEQFQNRKLGVPVSVGNSVVVGDFEGQVHFVAKDTGKTQARIATDGSAIVAAPVVVNGTVLVVTSKGGVYAIKPE